MKKRNMNELIERAKESNSLIFNTKNIMIINSLEYPHLKEEVDKEYKRINKEFYNYTRKTRK